MCWACVPLGILSVNCLVNSEFPCNVLGQDVLSKLCISWQCSLNVLTRKTGVCPQCQGVPLPPIESLPSSPALMGIVVHPRSPPSLLQLESPLSSPVEDHSGRISRRSQRMKRKGQRCRPSKLSTRQRLKEQEKVLQELPRSLASLALDGGSLRSEGSSRSCDKCWDLPCTYES